MSYLKALQILKNGGLIVFPCDTVMGVGCAMDKPEAIERLYKVKRRQKDQATAVLVSDSKMAESLMTDETDEFLKNIFKNHWPGALTVVVKASDIVPRSICGGTNFVGVRVPDHPSLQELIKELGTPLVATSANFKGEEAPVKFAEVSKEFLSLVDFAIPEDSTGTVASTVIKHLGEGRVEYLRRGSVSIKN
ncbi:threonylcarbamoyl-AMP synthase [Candidatus Dojkabacteria bacterium]|nr:threonylcarbamoyl-AMP synthase [Candidatus Dojkabacteria bacterium]